MGPPKNEEEKKLIMCHYMLAYYLGVVLVIKEFPVLFVVPVEHSLSVSVMSGSTNSVPSAYPTNLPLST